MRWYKPLAAVILLGDIMSINSKMPGVCSSSNVFRLLISYDFWFDSLATNRNSAAIRGFLMCGNADVCAGFDVCADFDVWAGVDVNFTNSISTWVAFTEWSKCGNSTSWSSSAKHLNCNEKGNVNTSIWRSRKGDSRFLTWGNSVRVQTGTRTRIKCVYIMEARGVHNR